MSRTDILIWLGGVSVILVAYFTIAFWFPGRRVRRPPGAPRLKVADPPSHVDETIAFRTCIRCGGHGYVKECPSGGCTKCNFTGVHPIGRPRHARGETRWPPKSEG